MNEDRFLDPLLSAVSCRIHNSKNFKEKLDRKYFFTFGDDMHLCLLMLCKGSFSQYLEREKDKLLGFPYFINKNVPDGFIYFYSGDYILDHDLINKIILE